MSLTIKEKDILKSMDKFVDHALKNRNKNRIIFLRKKEYLGYLEIVKKKERRDISYEFLNILEGMYRGFEVKKATL